MPEAHDKIGQLVCYIEIYQVKFYHTLISFYILALVHFCLLHVDFIENFIGLPDFLFSKLGKKGVCAQYLTMAGEKLVTPDSCKIDFDFASCSFPSLVCTSSVALLLYCHFLGVGTRQKSKEAKVVVFTSTLVVRVTSIAFLMYI